jgi:hypothetical protein
MEAPDRGPDPMDIVPKPQKWSTSAVAKADAATAITTSSALKVEQSRSHHREIVPIATEKELVQIGGLAENAKDATRLAAVLVFRCYPAI